MTMDIIQRLRCINKGDPVSQKAADEIERLRSERDALTVCLTKINDIRNSIIGLQRFNWSEHMYPLVELLDVAGFEGESYDKARKNFGALIDRCNKAEHERVALAATVDELRQVMHGIVAPMCDLRAARSFAYDVLFRTQVPSAILAARDARVKAQALREVGDTWMANHEFSGSRMHRHVAEWLIAQADNIEKGA